MIIFCWVLIGLLISSKICFRQKDLKIFIAYSSVVHMLIVGLIFNNKKRIFVVCLFLLSVGHGFCSALLFYFVGKFYFVSGTRNMNINFGNMWFFPFLMFLWVRVLILKCNFPPSIKFFSEILTFTCSNMLYRISIIGLIVSVFLGGLFKIYLFMKTTHSKSNKNLNFIKNSSFFFILITIFFLLLNLLSIGWWLIF